MADVIPLAPRRRLQLRACAYPRESAEILFFTGVRYERVAEPSSQTIGRPGGGRRAQGKALGRRKARQPA